MSLDVLSLLMGMNLGGSGEKTLESSGWVYSFGADTDQTENEIEMKSGGSAHNLDVAPPANVQRSHSFQQGDTLVLAVDVKAVSARVDIKSNYSNSGTAASKNGVFTIDDSNKAAAYAKTTGKDVLTFTSTSTSSGVRFKISPNLADGSTSSNVSATVEITGLAYNGNLIFGSVS